MNTLIKKVLVGVLLLLSIPAMAQSDVKENILEELENTLGSCGWGTENKDASHKFEQIYNDNLSNGIDNIVEEFADTKDKCYLIGYFLCSSYYTDINNNDLAIKIFKKGISLCSKEVDTVSFYWSMGHQLVMEGRLDEAKPVLLKAMELSTQYPGWRPARIKEETDIVNEFIETIAVY